MNNYLTNVSSNETFNDQFEQDLINNKTIFTDMINIFDINKLPNQNLYQILVRDKIDKFIFQHYFQNVIDLSDSNDLSNVHKIVNVNALSQYPDTGNIYTIPKEGISIEYIKGSLKDLMVHKMHSKEFALPTELNLTEIMMCINEPLNLTKKLWTVNGLFTPIETIKLLLQMLSIVDINITEDMYTYIKQPLSDYSLYRHINIYDKDQEKLNPYTYSLVVRDLKSEYSQTGIPLNHYP